MSGEMEPEHMRKVFIGGLHPDTTDESLRGYFSKYGEIVDCIVMRDSQTRRSRGFGFVAFDRSTCVDQLQNERPHHLDGKEVDTKRVVPKQTTTSQPRSDREQKVNKVFIGGLKDEISDEDIRQFFGQFGIVERLETFTDKETNRRKGFAFVTFQDFDSADKCVLSAQTNPDGKMNLQGYKVEVKKAKSQDEMKGGRGGGMRGGGRGGGGRGGFGGGRGGGGYGDFNQGYNQGGYGGGYNQSNGGGYSGGGGYNQGGYGGGGDGYQGGYNNGGGGGWGGNQGGGQQGGGGGGWGNGGGYGGGHQGGMGGGGYGGGGAGGGGYGGGHQGGMGGGGPMRGGYNKGNRSTPYGGGGGGGGGGWRN